MAEVTCLGIIVADLVGKPIDQYPERGRLLLVDRLELHSGGCASNTAIDLAKLGIDTAIIGKVGMDGLGDFVVGGLEKCGVDTSGVSRDPEVETSATMVMVHSDGERSFIHSYGANASFTEEDIDFDLFKGTKILHIAGAFLLPGIDGEPMARIFKRARDMGITTFLDTAWDGKGRWMSILEPCLQYVDYAVPSIEEARMVTGRHEPKDVAKVLMDHGIKVVGLKMGEAGCYIRSADSEIRIPRYEVEAMDAVGAGDAFAAGFLAGICRGWDLEQTGRLANAVGAICVTTLGATNGVRSLEETLAFMESRG